MLTPRPIQTLGVVASLLMSTLALGGIGDIDSAYGTRGVLANPGDWNMMTAMPDGRVVTATYEDSVLHVYMAGVNGQPDSAFAPGGELSIPIVLGAPYDSGLGTAAAAAPDGSIYLAFDPGTSTSAKLLRFTSAGVLDSGFGVNGVVTFASTDAASASAGAEILSVAILANGQVAVLVGYFSSIYDCANDLRMFRLTSSGVVDLEYEHGALQRAVGSCGEFGGVTLTAIGNGYLTVVAGEAPTVFDPAGMAATLHLEKTGIAGFTLSVSPDPSNNRVFVAGPSMLSPTSCAVSLLLPDLSHTGIDGDGDDLLDVSFGAVSIAPVEVRSCRVLAGAATGYIYVEALLRDAGGRTMVAISRFVYRGAYYPFADRRFGSDGIAVLGMEAAFGLFSEQADGSLLLSHGGIAGGPAQGGDAVIKLLGSNLPSPGMILLEAPPYPVLVVKGDSTNASVRRALGSSGAVTATYVVTARNDGPPVSFSPVRNLTLTWTDGEQGSRSALAISSSDAVGHYDLDSTSTPAAVSLHGSGAFSVVAPVPSPTGGPVVTPPAGGGSPDESGGGSLDFALLLTLGSLLAWRLSGGPARYSRSRSR
jgi:hypothetical protein